MQYRVRYQRSQTVWGLVMSPDEKLEVDVLRRLDRRGSHHIGGSMTMQVEPHEATSSNHPDMDTSGDLSYTLGYRWHSSDRQKIGILQWNTLGQSYLISWLRRMEIGKVVTLAGVRLLGSCSSGQSAACVMFNAKPRHLPLSLSARFLSTRQIAFMVEGSKGSLDWNLHGDYNGESIQLGAFFTYDLPQT